MIFLHTMGTVQVLEFDLSDERDELRTSTLSSFTGLLVEVLS